MTELNHPAVREEITWPDLDVQGTDPVVGQDQAVSRAVETLRDIPGLPVADHPERFAATHDALLAALNDETSLPPEPAKPGAPRPGGR